MPGRGKEFDSPKAGAPWMNEKGDARRDQQGKGNRGNGAVPRKPQGKQG